jgi:hypothetical protein
MVSRLEWKEVACEQAIKAELSQLFNELKALQVIKRVEVTKSAKVLKTHMFLVRKYLADGSFDKVKARLVADGRDQDAELYPNKSSPTVAIHSVFTVLWLAATKTWRIVVKIDVKGAFIQTPMSGEPTFMKLDPKVSKYAVELFPNLKKMLEADGRLYTVLLKAMNGCVQASALWYAMIKAELEKLGYSVGPTDPCVFIKQVGNRIFILLLYVDDILAIVNKEEAKKIRMHLVTKFGSVQFKTGGRLSYLGMEINVTYAGMSVDMSFYVKQLLEDAKERMSLVVYASLGMKETFVANDEEQQLQESERVFFHSTVAKLLYLSKRARPDILTVVTYLCTRVQNATVGDEKKLVRVLGYWEGTVSRALLLRATSTDCNVVAYIDAAYALHGDSKSHSGIVMYVGNTLVYVSSRKQKCMSKSPTEAELIALTDNLGLVELFQEFVVFVMKKTTKTPMIFQDCIAVVMLVMKGGGKL